MQTLPLGKVQVPTPGTPVTLASAMTAALTATQLAFLPPNGAVHKIQVWADTADSGITYVKSASGVKIAPLPVPANGHCEHFAIAAGEGNLVNPGDYAFDAATASQGPLVTLWVE
jgi:hypothetical protein